MLILYQYMFSVLYWQPFSFGLLQTFERGDFFTPDREISGYAPECLALQHAIAIPRQHVPPRPSLSKFFIHILYLDIKNILG